MGLPGGYLVERWVRGCVAQIGCFFSASQVFQWPLFYVKIGSDYRSCFCKMCNFRCFFVFVFPLVYL